MTDLIKSLIYMYADDAKSFNKACMDSASLQSDLDTLCEWSTQWQMKFNTDKWTVMHFGSHNVQKQYTMLDHSGNVHFSEATMLEKDLGMVWSINWSFLRMSQMLLIKLIKFSDLYEDRLHI